jgi:hypothetical protein
MLGLGLVALLISGCGGKSREAELEVTPVGRTEVRQQENLEKQAFLMEIRQAAKEGTAEALEERAAARREAVTKFVDGLETQINNLFEIR